MNTARAAGAGRTRAAPIARPINGPLQGVAMKAVSAPVQNAPPAPSRIINPPPIEIEGNSNMPTRLKVMIAIRAVSERITYGFCKIGRASCRERVGQYVENSVVAEALKNKKN